LSAETVKAKLLLDSVVIFDKHMEFALRGLPRSPTVTAVSACLTIREFFTLGLLNRALEWIKIC